MFLRQYSRALSSGPLWPRSSIAVIVLAAFLCQMTGCAFLLPDMTTSSFVQVGTWEEWRHGRASSPIILKIDGELPQKPFWHVAAGVHTFVVAVEWSNGWQDQTELTFEARAGGWYVISTYELAPDEPEEEADARRYTDLEQLARAILTTPLHSPLIVIGLAIPLVAYWGVRKMVGKDEEVVRDARPFERCCFVWVQEGECGRVVAGERPGGGTPHQ